MNKNFTVTISESDANVILASLGEQPAKLVNGAINRLQAQLQQQVNQQPAAPEPEPPKE